MKIYNCNNLLLDVNTSNTIIIDSQHLFFDFNDVKSCYHTILDNLLIKCPRDTKLVVRDFESKDLEILVLIGLTELGCSFIYNAKVFEVSFAHAIPLNRDLFLKKYTIDNLDACLCNHQIVFLPHDSLYIIDHIDKEKMELLCRKEKRTIAKNQETVIIETDFSQDFFDFWKWYVNDRYNTVLDDDFISFFKHVYSQGPFKLYAYLQKNKLVAYSVCYYSNEEKILYDVLFPWKKNSAYRIGIYSIIRNIEEANNIGWGYSLCYGKFPYKDAIFKHLIHK